MIKNILFDIDDTLFPSTEFSSLARKNAINAMIGMGLTTPYHKLDSMLHKIISKKGSNSQEHFNELCKELAIKKPARYIAAAVAAYHDTKTSIQTFPKVPLTLLALRKNGYGIYAATNGNAVKQWDKLIRLRISLYFDGVFVSEEVGREKDKIFFQKITRELKCLPAECIMVGDKEDSDISPARSLGLKTVRVLPGKYSKNPTKADFSLSDISELTTILQDL